MPYFKHTWKFVQPDKGWSEVYYVMASDLNQAAFINQDLLTKSLLLRHRLTVLKAIIVSSVDNNRNSVIVPINQTKASNLDTPDIAGAAVVCSMNSLITGAKRSLWIRGVPDGYVFRDRDTGVDVLEPAYRQFLVDFFGAYWQINCCIRSLLPIGVAPQVFTPVQSVTVTGVGYVTITVPTGFAVSASSRVILSQMDPKLFPGLNGQYRAYDVTATQFKVAYNSHLTPTTYFVTKGRVRPAEYQYGVISPGICEFKHYSTRDTGRNPFGGRGRRRPLSRRSA